jgi:hypothetical protein
VNKAIVGQATKRLAGAQKKASALANARNAEEIEELWSEFLTQYTRFFNRLGHAMETGAEKGRWERILAKRVADPMTAYLMQARNADEHGRNLITTRGWNFTAGSDGEDVIIDSLVVENGSIKEAKIRAANTGRPARLKFNPSEVFPAAVENRGVTYSVPDTLPVASFAQHAMRHLNEVLSSATEAV